MKINRFAAISMAALMLSPMTAYADETNYRTFDQFNKNEVNGTLTVNIPEGCTADISITFDSPEGPALPYYKVEKGKSGSYSFDIEGRDNNKSDYRYYNLSVTLTSVEYGNVSEAFTDVVNGTAKDSFLIPDKNDNPDSLKKYTYNFSCDDVNNGKSWELTDSDETSKTVTVHLNFIPVGDVNGDGHIDGVDASDILTAYAKESAGGKSDLSAAQKKAADVNGDKVMDGNDASLLLSYYAYVSAKGNVTLAEFMADRV